VHWTRLTRDPLAQASRWPAPVRWLDGLERVVLRFGWLQRWVVRAHARAFSGLDAATGTIGVVGGGLFPRTAMVAQKLWPGARVTLIDADRDHLEEARRWVQGVEFVHARYSGAGGFDAVVIPLAYDGDREAIYARPPAPLTIVHDWIWRRRGESRVVSWLLLKRLNVVRR
jgi:hypothetical protein